MTSPFPEAAFASGKGSNHHRAVPGARCPATQSPNHQVTESPKMPTPSSATLSTLRDRVEIMLQDSTNATWAAGDIDEAIRQALHAYEQVVPRQALTAITLSSAGREVDISSVTGYLEILRVWWDYDSTDPEHPPNWRDFEVWPGDLLWINDGDAPASGDKVRLWYTLTHTLNGLDSATATTFAADHESTIAIGAAGFAALFRSQEVTETVTADGWAPRNLREWGNTMIAEFTSQLHQIARRAAASASGIAAAPPLDRWDEERDW